MNWEKSVIWAQERCMFSFICSQINTNHCFLKLHVCGYRWQYLDVSDNRLTHPKVVHDLDGLLELYGNVHCNIMVETWANGELLWQWRPVVLTPCVDKGNKMVSYRIFTSRSIHYESYWYQVCVQESEQKNEVQYVANQKIQGTDWFSRVNTDTDYQ